MRSILSPLASLVALSAVVAGGVALDRVSPTWAQTAPTSGSLGDLFEADAGTRATDLAADALPKIKTVADKAAAECSKAKLHVVVEKGDPLYQQALAIARRDVIGPVLERLGMTPNRYDFSTDWEGSASDVQVRYEPMEDMQPPKLRTTSTPQARSRKVQPNEPIVVTLTARDDANRWQSGIKTLTLVADSAGDALVAGPTYPRAPAGCADPRTREVQVTYAVPADPPPIVRLTATGWIMST